MNSRSLKYASADPCYTNTSRNLLCNSKSTSLHTHMHHFVWPRACHKNIPHGFLTFKAFTATFIAFVTSFFFFFFLSKFTFGLKRPSLGLQHKLSCIHLVMLTISRCYRNRISVLAVRISCNLSKQDWAGKQHAQQKPAILKLHTLA